MKTNKMGREFQFRGGLNLCAVDDNGSPMTTQIWDGGDAEATRKLFELLGRAKAPLNERYEHFFIHPHGNTPVGKQTFHFTRKWLEREKARWMQEQADDAYPTIIYRNGRPVDVA